MHNYKYEVPSCDQPLALATAYVPDQPYVGLVPLEEGFTRGSIFKNLYHPYKKH